MRNKRWLLPLIITFLAVFALAWPATHWQNQNIRASKVVHRSRLQPVILVPGSSANQERFNTLVSLLNQRTRGHSLLKVTVSTTGKLSITGKIAARDNEPYIVIAFADNKDGYPTIKKQAKWFSTAFTKLATKYHFDRFSGIGHSNGGLVLTIFLEKYMKQSAYTMKNLMTIGSPYNLEESNASNRTQMLADLIKARKKLPKSLNVYSIAGTENYSGDGTVPLSSVEAGKYIFQNVVAHYTFTTVTGSDAAHSDLPQNKQIVQLIRTNILVTPDRRTGGTPQ